MKTLKLIIAALAVCGPVNAQVITEQGTIFEGYSHIRPILPDFTVDGKARFLLEVEDELDFSRIYNDELEYIDVNVETEPVTAYRKTREREWASWSDPETGEYYAGYIGDWVEYESEYVWGNRIEDPYFVNMNRGVGEDAIMPFSQTLFNNDEAYEYIIPTYKIEIKTEEDDRDGDGIIDYEVTYSEAIGTGFKIKSTDGSTLQTVTFGDEYDFYEVGGLYIINDKYYLGVWVDTKDRHETYHIFYRINKETSSIQQVGEPMKVSVRPRVADRSESFTVELDGDNGKPCEVVVTTAGGRTVWSQNVPAGQTSVNISAARLGKGLNIITVNGREQRENTKVIVK